MNNTRDGTKHKKYVNLPRGIRKHHTGKYIVDASFKQIRKTRVFDTVEAAIIGRWALKKELKYTYEFIRLQQSNTRGKNMSTLISFSQSAGAIDMVKNIETYQEQGQQEQEIGYIDVECSPSKPTPTADFIFPVTGHKVRTVQYESKTWFVARDVAAVLGYVLPQKAIIDHCKHAKVLKGSETAHLTTSPRGINIIPESDVYRLVMRSKLPTAEAFQDWIVEVVLPALRRDGGYMMSTSPTESPEDILARAVIIAQKTIERQTVELLEAKPAVSALNRMTKGQTLWPFREALRHLGVSMKDIHAVCKKHRILRREKVENSYRLWPTKIAISKGLVEKTYKPSGGLSYGFTPAGIQWLKDKLYLA